MNRKERRAQIALARRAKFVMTASADMPADQKAFYKAKAAKMGIGIRFE